ncbi:hypothetical protein ACR3H8_20430 [Pseudomonas aeruginosa]|uniref:hypothetical protein n=1 Tax=Pseudomonas aeruginosa TaxID=287 RepID=UPI000F8202EC|nr:hypothetical protein [Pseudomonas aeruginosa]EIU2716863.1 hypothetical protein [Pseudomonas aeruginosa]EIU2862428.1 hypothetical protein [Pseudomonas aeruginosa]MCT5450459.1 hypothetical protein [Pseudomonas aeruginosa]RTU13302.1 hypothetical protein DY969_25980 [Pseudomonas aeruginosa]RTV53072.1 hypothetical protein DY989_21510 [Pseudomonas aeruginosa]
MTYKKCNEVLEGVFKDSLNAAPESHVVVPWGVSLNGVGRFAAVAAIGAGMVGVAKNQSGKYKLYYGAKGAGNWLFEIWPLWKSASVFSLYAAVWNVVRLSGIQGMQVGGMVIMALLGLALFGGRAVNFRKHYPAAVIAGSRGYASGLVPSLLGVAMAVGSALAAYAFTQGMKMGSSAAFNYMGIAGNLKELARYFVLVLPMVLAVAFIAQAALNLFSIEAMVRVVSSRADFTRNLRGAAEVSGLRGLYEDKFGKRAGGNVFATLVFGVILAGLALWPLGYVTV